VRVGTNPLRRSNEFRRLERITVAMVTHIPILAGYWEQSLDVLELCIASLRANTHAPFDLMVFDNGSCPEVIRVLQELQAVGALQYLILSDTNVGLAAARNFLFGAAPGEYVAYTDSDVYFYPGWLEAEMQVLEAFPNVGMVSGVPTVHNFGKFTDSTIKRVEENPEIVLERGRFIPDEWVIQYAESIGKSEAYLRQYEHIEHIRLTFRGVRAYATATHFQFLARSSVLRKLPPSPVPAAGVQGPGFDKALDDYGYMRLSVDGVFIYHLGNTLTDEWRAEASRSGVDISSVSNKVGRERFVRRLVRRIARVGPVRKPLVFVYNQMFKVLYLLYG
jgi:glycosyltransferase involved in cell wall biosynthesis